MDIFFVVVVIEKHFRMALRLFVTGLVGSLLPRHTELLSHIIQNQPYPMHGNPHEKPYTVPQNLLKVSESNSTYR